LKVSISAKKVTNAATARPFPRAGASPSRLGAKEETIAAQIAHYLRPFFPEFNVDVEYSRMGEVPKKVTYEVRPQKVYPDIIVHIRDNRSAGIPDNEANVLAIELKKDTNTEKSERDIRKLGAYRTELGYRHALFMRFGTKKNAGEVLECRWVDV
jgi:hypothetical protein